MPTDRPSPSLFPAAAAASSQPAPGSAPGAAAAPVSGSAVDDPTVGRGPGIFSLDGLDAASPATADQVAQAIAWLRWGRCRGLASEALLFAALAGTPPRPGDHAGLSHPDCRADLYRCLHLTTVLPWARRGLDVLAGASRPWAALRQDWDLLAATMARETGPSWPAIDRRPTGWWQDTPETTAQLRRTLARAGAKT